MAAPPPKAFFDELERLFREVVDELRAEGFEPHRFDCLPTSAWRDGWWSCRGFQVFARAERGGFRRVERAIDPEKFRRPVRRIRRSGKR